MDLLASLLDRQQTRLLQLHFPQEDGPAAGLLINRLDAREALSEDFVFTLELISDDANIELKDVIGKQVTVELERASGAPRYFNGYATDFRFLHSDGGYAFYGLTLRPWLAFLARRTDNYLFHDKTTRQALTEIFGDYPEQSVEFRVAGGKTGSTGDSLMISLRTLFSMVSATASSLFIMPLSLASAAAGPRSTINWIRLMSSNAEIFSLSSARM